MAGSRGFPRASRLTRRADFDRVFSEGRRVRTRHFMLLVAQGASEPRLGMAIGRRFSPRAVDRNRMKRLIREVFRHAGLAPFDVIVTVQAGAARETNQALRAELARAFGELG